MFEFRGIAGLARMAVAGIGLCGAIAQAATVTYNFDGLMDGELVTNQFAGLSFTNATVLTAGISLNEFEFPPRSGGNVVIDDGGAIEIVFGGPVYSVGAYFTHVSALSVSVYDTGDALLGSLFSSFGNNLLVSGEAGSSANELLSFADASGRIARIVIQGDMTGGSFVMDDLTIDNGRTVPEPQTLALVAGLLGLGCTPGGWLRRRRRH